MGVNDVELEQVAESLNEKYGDPLRAVAAFVREDYRIEYMRDDVQEEIGEETVYEILDESQLSALGHPGYEDLYGGDLEGVVRIFEHTVVLTVPVERAAGILVSLDREADFRGRHVIATVENTLESANNASD